MISNNPVLFDHSKVQKDPWGDWSLYDQDGECVRTYSSKQAAVNGAKRYELHLNDHLDMIEYGVYRGYFILELNKDCYEYKKGSFVAIDRTEYESRHPDLSTLISDFNGSSAEAIRAQIDEYWKFELEESEKTAPKKFEFTDETTMCDDHLLHRIRACITFRVHGVCSEEVCAGDLGGFLEKESNLSQTDHSWVFDDSMVGDDAYICNGACITDGATVSGNAVISENAVVRGFAEVDDFAVVSGRALIIGVTRVCGNAVITGEARIDHHAVVCENAVVSGNARVSGTAYVSGNARITDHAIVRGDAKVSGDTTVDGSTCIGEEPDWSKEKNRLKKALSEQSETEMER